MTEIQTKPPRHPGESAGNRAGDQERKRPGASADPGSVCITAAAVRRLCGNISDMSLWRWLDNPAMGFPKPFYIQKRRYWREADIQAWIVARESSGAAA